MCLGTLQKSYVCPCWKVIFIRMLFSSYPIAKMADELTRIISMGAPYLSDEWCVLKLCE